MRLLVVDSNRTEREATLRLIPSDANEIRVARDAVEALSLLETHEFDVALIETTLIGTSGSELVKRIRAGESASHLYVVMTAARPQPGDVRTAFLVGADDFMRKPLARDELLARLDGPTRIRRWASKIGSVVEKSPLTSISAWTTADSALCSELADMFGLTLMPMAVADALDGAVEVAMLPLSLASEQTEVALAVGVDETTAQALAETMFGSPDVDVSAIKDMMREIANVAAGAFKRIAATEGRFLTTGLPAEVTPQTFRKPTATARKQWMATVEGTPIALRFELELNVRELKRLRVGVLREGMVVAADVKNPLGGVLVPASTRVTEHHLAGLRRSLGLDAVVEIVEAA